MKNLLLALTLVLFGGGILIAQIPARSNFSQKKEAAKNFVRSDSNNFLQTAEIQMPAIDMEKIRKEELKEAGKGGPLRFGENIPVDLGLEAGTWQKTDTGNVWRLTIKSKNALSINLGFKKFKLAEGASLMIYNGDETMKIGPITHLQNNADDSYATGIIQGDGVIIELYEPFQIKGKSLLQIGRVTHGYVDLFSAFYAGYGASADCNVNVNCSAIADFPSNAVGMIIVGGKRACSGALLNNACYNFTPNFLTAFHCLESDNIPGITQAELDAVANWVVMFQYKSPECTPANDSYLYQQV